MKKKLAVLTMLLLIVSLTPQGYSFAQDEIKVKYNTEQLDFETQPYIKNGRTLVPFRKILEKFGSEVGWDGENKIVSAKNNTTMIKLKIGIDYAFVDGRKINLDVAPEITNGRTFIPIRFISENLGAEVNWDGPTKTVFINFNDKTYKMGQEGLYKDLKFRIDKVNNLDSERVLIVDGALGFKDEGLGIEVVDDYGYVLSGRITYSEKSMGMYNIEVKMSLPGCHNFEGKHLIIKRLNDEQKSVKIAQYEI